MAPPAGAALPIAVFPAPLNNWHGEVGKNCRLQREDGDSQGSDQPNRRNNKEIV